MATVHHRPTYYDADFHVSQGYRLALLGFTVKKLALAFDVSHQTIKNWFKRYPDFYSAVNRGRVQADAQVAEALYKRATGFEVDTVEVFVIKTSKTEQQVKLVDTKTYYPPDPKAALHWLKNRQPANWRDKQVVGVTGEIHLTMNLDSEQPATV
ncbi:hypothetical protein GCM10027592_63170 [Spirosoma flavus]